MSAEPAHPQRIVDVLVGEDEPLLNATQLAARLGVARAWVYDHAAELGAVRLGAGPRARLRFDPITVAERLSGDRRTVRPRTARPRRAATVALLPIKSPTGRRGRRTLE